MQRPPHVMCMYTQLKPCTLDLLKKLKYKKKAVAFCRQVIWSTSDLVCYVLNRMGLTKERLDSPTESTFWESTALTSLADSLEESVPVCIIQWGRRGEELV